MTLNKSIKVLASAALIAASQLSMAQAGEAANVAAAIKVAMGLMSDPPMGLQTIASALPKATFA